MTLMVFMILFIFSESFAPKPPFVASDFICNLSPIEVDDSFISERSRLLATLVEYKGKGPSCLDGGSDNYHIYIGSQTLGLSGKDYFDCINDLISNVNLQCYNSIGGQYWFPNQCMLRFEIYPFCNQNQMTSYMPGNPFTQTGENGTKPARKLIETSVQVDLDVKAIQGKFSASFPQGKQILLDYYSICSNLKLLPGGERTGLVSTALDNVNSYLKLNPVQAYCDDQKGTTSEVTAFAQLDNKDQETNYDCYNALLQIWQKDCPDSSSYMIWARDYCFLVYGFKTKY